MSILAKVVVYPIRLMIKIASKLWMVLAVYFASRFAAMFIISYFEGWKLFDSWWWTGVASLTIGYGDFFPKTVPGRLIADGFQLFWIFYCAPAIIALMVNYLIKNPHMLTHLEQEWLFTVVTRIYQLLVVIYQLLVAVATKHGVRLPDDMPNFIYGDDTVEPLPPQPSDLDGGEELEDEFDDPSSIRFTVRG